MRKEMGRRAAGVALAALLGATFGWAQNDRSAVNGAQEPTSATQTQARHQIQMVGAKAELEKGLNAKKLKPGQKVTAKLEDTVNLPNEPALKRNTVLVGQVDAVQASQHHSNSNITVTFNQAKLKDGTMLPVKVTVLKVSEPAMNQAATGGPMAEGGAAPEAGSAAGAGAPGGGPGSGAGAAPGASPGMTPPQPQPMNTTEPGAQPTTATAQSGGVPGVMLQSDIHQSTSATFLSKGRNVDVPSGTQMQVAIAYVPKGVQVH